jgi:succinyl-CoA synthetase alpha subunit
MSTSDAKPGSIGIVSRSASLTSEIVAQTSAAGLGQSTTVGIGADPLHGIGFVDCLRLFMADEETKGVILIGEIGGSEEEATAEFLRRERPAKPVVALVAGRHAPQLRRMGHAGAFTDGGRGQAAAKIEALRAAGARVAQTADHVAETMRQVLQEARS